MKTVKLYDQDSHLKEFDAVVLEVRSEETGCSVILNQTAFFPMGGGQEADTGTLGGIPVTDVREEQGEIRHYLSGTLAVGAEVRGMLNWPQRFNRMQHHSAEHIVSGLVHQKYGYENVGFHVTDESAVLDFSGVLSTAQLEEIALLANRVVWENLPVSAEYPPQDALKNIEYRSKLDLTENVRIVTFPGYDVCACCAPHVTRTGEIGCIRLTDLTRHRGGVRVTLYAGENAFRDYAEKARTAQEISALLSAKQNETAKAVQKLHQDYLQLKRTYQEAKMQLLTAKAEQIPPTDGNLLLFEENLDANALRNYVNLMLPKCGGICIALSGSDETGYSYVAASASRDMRAFAKELNTALHGKGGGKPEMIQGSLTATQKEIEAFLKNC